MVGNGGETIFFQNEMPYDPPNQAAWMNGSSDGYAAYKVGPNVTTHQAYGLGSYCYFNVNPAVVADHAFEAPDSRRPVPRHPHGLLGGSRRHRARHQRDRSRNAL